MFNEVDLPPMRNSIGKGESWQTYLDVSEQQLFSSICSMVSIGPCSFLIFGHRCRGSAFKELVSETLTGIVESPQQAVN